MAVNSLFAKITLLKKPANWTHLEYFQGFSSKYFEGQKTQIILRILKIFGGPGFFEDVEIFFAKFSLSQDLVVK